MFSYDETKILNDVSFKINPGEFITIVGASGTGKTTLIDMLLGFNIPNTGIINIDDVDISKINKKSIRKIIGYYFRKQYYLMIQLEIILHLETIKLVMKKFTML